MGAGTVVGASMGIGANTSMGVGAGMGTGTVVGVGEGKGIVAGTSMGGRGYARWRWCGSAGSGAVESERK